MSVQVQAEALHQSFGSLEVLRDISFGVEPGGFVSLIGPSGCGKTTLLKLIAGLLKPTRGSLLIDGQSPLDARKRGILGFAFQRPTLLPWRDVRHNILLPLEILPKNGRGDPEAILATVGLEKFAGAYPAELSGGMLQRVALARALIHNPRLLLMDEPFGSLDEITREDLNLELLRIWNDLKPTIVFVTHSLREAALLSDRVIILGRLPAQKKMEVTIPFSRPRTLEMTTSAEFSVLLTELRSQLQ